MQEQDDEVYGNGNLNTAEFWGYDARLGRRWNLDRINKLWESAYLAFENCPILFKDTRGLSSEIGSTSNQSEQLVSHKTGLDYRGKKSDMLELSPLPAPTRESKWDKKEANSLISNSANVIWASPKLNCEMCCLSALASNLNVLYNKSFSGDFDDMVQSTGNASSMQRVPPTLNDNRLTSNEPRDDFASNNFKSNIPQTMLQMTDGKGIYMYAVGVASNYHTMIIIVLKGRYKIKNEMGNVIARSSSRDPYFILLDPHSCGDPLQFDNRYGDMQYLNTLLQQWYLGGRAFYNGDLVIEGAKPSTAKDIDMDAHVYQL